MKIGLSLEVGDTIDDRYRVERVLGRGGMGIVVAARRPRLTQPVAIKFPLAHLAQRKDIWERLLREAQAATQLRSEHVARVYDVGLHRGYGPYLVMEYLEGEDLGATLERGPLPCDLAAEYVLQACEALAEAHAAGIVHRDLKPSNLFLTRRPDGSPLIKVIDFGLAKRLHPEQDSTLTNSNTPLGSPSFMAPEQMCGTASLDARVDVFSLGAAFFALLAGAPPFPGKNVLEIYENLRAGPPSIRARRADISSEIDAVIHRCLATAPEGRFANMAELAEALAPLASAHAMVHAQRARRILTGKAKAVVSEVSRQGYDRNSLGGADGTTTASWAIRSSSNANVREDVELNDIRSALPTGHTPKRLRSTWSKWALPVLLLLFTLAIAWLLSSPAPHANAPASNALVEARCAAPSAGVCDIARSAPSRSPHVESLTPEPRGLILTPASTGPAARGGAVAPTASPSTIGRSTQRRLGSMQGPGAPPLSTSMPHSILEKPDVKTHGDPLADPN